MGTRESNFLKLAYQSNLSLFIQRAFSIISPHDIYLHNWHIDVISEHLMACAEKKIKRLIINIPPRTAKSISCTVAFPAWLMGRNPTCQIMAASYSRDLSHKHSQDTRFLMQSEWYKTLFPKTLLAKDQNEKGKFMTTERGQRMAVSVGSRATGEGAEYIIVDDLLNPLQAASDLERENANTYFKQTLLSRFNNPSTGVAIVVMQRLHQNDITGMLLEMGGWDHLCLPVINDHKRTFSIGRGESKTWEEGELLHPERMSSTFLTTQKHEMGTNAFTGQYLQRPAPEGGSIIKKEWWKLWEPRRVPKIEFVLQVYDTAFTEDTANDFCARTTWGIFCDDNNIVNIILLEALNKRMEFPELRSEAKTSYHEFDPDLVIIEEKASGIILIQEFTRSGLRVRAQKRNRGSGDKVYRAHMSTPVFEQGVVWVPTNVTEADGKKVYKPKSYAQEVIDSCAIFPFGTHDDLVDTVTDAILFLRKYKDVRTKTDKEDEPDYSYESGKKKRFY